MPETEPDDEIFWTEAGAPRSRLFDDVFFSDVDGLAESRHVFLHSSGFSDRLASGGLVRVGEIGFGLGLNFCAALTALSAERGTELDYCGFERRSYARAHIERALSPWPELRDAKDALLAVWPLADGAPNRVTKRATLSLHLGDAADRIDALHAPRDVWWLDGFSPAKNPDAWAPSLLTKIFERTAPGGGLATYAAAGWVRRGLLEAGFEVVRAPGFATKREMLIARRAA